MKYLLALALIFSIPAHADTDKYAHFGVSYALNQSTYGFFKSRFGREDALVIATTATFTVGLAKEVFDGQFDTGDLGANLAGIIASSLCTWTFEF
jgi:hypothetical protein